MILKLKNKTIKTKNSLIKIFFLKIFRLNAINIISIHNKIKGKKLTNLKPIQPSYKCKIKKLYYMTRCN